MSNTLQILGLLLTLLLGRLAVQAQVPAWQTLAGIVETTGNNLQVSATTVDASGNVLLVGRFSGTVGFGRTVLTSVGATDAFVAKWNPVNGILAWAYQAGGAGEDEANAVAVSGTNVYVGGSFNGASATFGSVVLTNSSTDCLQDSLADLFVAKLIDAGTSASFTWAQRPVGNYSESCTHLAVDGNQVYLTGNMVSKSFLLIPSSNQCTSLNKVTFGTTELSHIGPGNLGFVAKLIDTGGNATFGWAATVGGAGNNAINDLVLQGSNVYLAGSYTGISMYFGTPDMGSELFTPPNFNSREEGFVLKLNDAGSSIGLVWAQRTAGTSDGRVSRVAIRGTEVYVAGAFGGVASIGITALTTAGGSDVFVAKLADNGNSSTFAWAQRMGGIGSDEVTALAVQETSLYLAGTFSSATADFGSTTLTNPAGGGQNLSTLFVAKMLAVSNGLFSWAKGVGGTGLTKPTNLALDGGRVSVRGIADATAIFDKLTFANPAGSRVVFLASLTEPTLTATSQGIQAEAIRLFPNPAHNHVTVQLPGLPSAATATFTVFDALGRAVRTAAAPANTSYPLDVSGLAPGVYALRVQVGDAQATQRLVVE